MTMEALSLNLLSLVLPTVGCIEEVMRLREVCRRWKEVLETVPLTVSFEYSEKLGMQSWYLARKNPLKGSEMGFRTLWTLNIAVLNLRNQTVSAPLLQLAFQHCSIRKLDLSYTDAHTEYHRFLVSVLAREELKRHCAALEELRISGMTGLDPLTVQKSVSVFPNLRSLYANNIPSVFPVSVFFTPYVLPSNLQTFSALHSGFGWTGLELPVPRLVFGTVSAEITAVLATLGCTVVSSSLQDLLEGYFSTGELTRLEQWIAAGGDINLREEGHLVLMKSLNQCETPAAFAHVTKLVKFCVFHGLSSTQNRTISSSFLTFAFKHDLEDLFRFLFAVKMPLYSEKEDVLKAVMSGNDDKYVDLLVDLKGCDLPRPKSECTALCFAFQCKTEARARSLMQRGLSPAQCSAHLNIFLSYPNITYSLLESGDLINLHKATVYNLIQLGLYRREESKAVALLTQFSSQLDLLAFEEQYIIKTPPRGRNRDFRCLSRPLAILAIEASAEECWKLLLSLGFLLEIQDEHGWTPLIAAASLGSLPKVQTLLSLGAAKDHRDKTSRTALHQAAQYGHLSIVKALVEAGASPAVTSVDGDFPFDLALDNKHVEVVNYLVSVGADKRRLRQQCCVS